MNAHPVGMENDNTIYGSNGKNKMNEARIMEFINEPIEFLPLRIGKDNAIVISGTEVPFSAVINAFGAGKTPEGITHQYPVLNLADVYSVLGYYLRYQAQVDNYLKRQKSQRQSAAQSLKTKDDSVDWQDKMPVKITVLVSADELIKPLEDIWEDYI
ncbi:MAG: DUF433 domain-containing protein [Chloroflexota bacterium]